MSYYVGLQRLSDKAVTTTTTTTSRSWHSLAFFPSAPLRCVSVVGAPVAVVAGHQAPGDEQDQVHEPPDSKASQGEQLSNGGAGVAQAEAVHPETAQEEGVEQRGDEVVAGVPMQGEHFNVI